MNKFYSPSTRGFYSYEIHGTNMPNDVVSVIDELYYLLMDAQSNGSSIAPDNNGLPSPINPEQPTVEDLKQLMWEKIKAKRTEIQSGGVFVSGKWFHTDQASRIQQLGLAIINGDMPQGIMWKTMDGSFVEMTSIIASSLLSAVGALDIAAFTAAEVHKAALNLSSDPENYDFSTGWPTVYSTS